MARPDPLEGARSLGQAGHFTAVRTLMLAVSALSPSCQREPAGGAGGPHRGAWKPCLSSEGPGGLRGGGPRPDTVWLGAAADPCHLQAHFSVGHLVLVVYHMHTCPVHCPRAPRTPAPTRPEAVSTPSTAGAPGPSTVLSTQRRGRGMCWRPGGLGSRP